MAIDRTQSTASRENSAKEELTALLAIAETRRAEFLKLLPNEVSWDVFKDTFKLAIQRTPRLMEADRQSLWIALQKCAIDGLKPDGREAALVIFADDEEDESGNRVPSKAGRPKQVVYMPMAYGLITMVRNTGNVASIRAKLVYRGEIVEVCDEEGAETYKHTRTLSADSQIDDSPENIIAAYAVVNYKDGSWEAEFMSRRQIDRVRAVSRAKKGPWLPWYDEMAKKTVLRRLIKRLDKSPVNRIEAALDRDETMTIDGVALEPQPAIAPPKEIKAPENTPRPPKTGPIATDDHGVAGPATEADQQRQEADKASPQFLPIDDIGEPVMAGDDALALVGPVAFAEWFAAAYVASERKEALQENNADAIEEASADPAARKIIEEALGQPQQDRRRQDAMDDLPSDDEPVALPLTPDGKPHWPNYAKECEAKLAALTTVEQIYGWELRNIPTYHGKAYEAKIEALVRVRRKAIAPRLDKDAQWVEDAIESLQQAKSKVAINGVMDGQIMKTRMERFARERPELHERMAQAVADKLATVP